MFSTKPPHLACIPRVLLLLLLLMVLGPRARAETTLPHGVWSDSGSFRLPPKRTPIAEPGPNLSPRRLERRELEVGLHSGLSHKLCPADVDRCDSAAGLGFALRGAARPTPHFAWGLVIQHSSFEQVLTVETLELEASDRTTSVALFGRLLPSSMGVLDPFIEFGVGGGNFTERGKVTLANTESVAFDEDRLAPLMRAGMGLDVHVSSRLKLGAQFQWTHWLLSSHERCRGVAFGACTLPSFGHFDVNNAVWDWQLGATLLFGAQH